MGAVLVALLAAAAVAYVVRPMRAEEVAVPEPDAQLEEATAKKQGALLAILDVEEEHEAGKLTEADYRELRLRYELEAVAALRDLDAIDASDPTDAELEEEIARLRAALTCPACGALRATGTRCPSCDES